MSIELEHVPTFDVAIVEETNMFLNAHKQIAEAAAETKLPSVYGYREYTETG
jgi:hypothetical protein